MSRQHWFCNEACSTRHWLLVEAGGKRTRKFTEQVRRDEAEEELLIAQLRGMRRERAAELERAAQEWANTIGACTPIFFSPPPPSLVRQPTGAWRGLRPR